MATASGVLFQNPIVKPLSSNGAFMSACTATFYLAGTTTLTPVYADGALTTPLANPLSSDASGTFVAVYLNPTVTYRVQIKTSTGVLISDTDPINLGIFGTNPTNKQFANSGAQIQRLNDRLMIADAAVNDGNFPNVTKDWLTAYQLTLQNVAPTIPGSQMAVLANRPSGIGAAATFGASSLNQTSAGFVLSCNSFAINDNPTFRAQAWAYYGEAHRVNDAVSTVIGMELDVVQRGSLAQIDPYFQSIKEAVGYLSAAGAGLNSSVSMAPGTPGVVTWNTHGLAANQVVLFSSTYGGTGTLPAALTSNVPYYVAAVLSANTFTVSATPGGAAIAFAGSSTAPVVATSQYPATAAYYIAANPVCFDKGIVFTRDSISGTDGVNGTGLAINFAKGHLLQWWGSTGVPTGNIQGSGTTLANASGINLGEGFLQITNQNGLTNTYFRGVNGAVNFFNFYPGAAGNPCNLQTQGSDTNVDLAFTTQGAASFVKFASASHFTANGAVAMSLGSTGPTGASGTPSKWLVIKDNVGAKFAIAAYAIP